MGAQADHQLRLRVGMWRDAFRDEVTGIHRTLDDLVWSYAAFRTAIRVVNLASQRIRKDGGDPDRAPVNQMLFDLMAAGYWSTLLLGIRRLVDGSALNGDRGVYSLTAVINDVRDCRTRLNRRTYVEVLRGCRYDLDQLRAEQWERLSAAGGGPLWGDPDLPRSEFAHKDFDFLSGTSETNRSEGDLIREEILDRLDARLTAMSAIARHVSTHLAHAGNAQSREGKNLDEFDIRDGREALKALKQIADLVGPWFANEGGAGLATYQGDQFEALDQPLVSPGDMGALQTNWEEIDRDVDGWRLDPAVL